MAFKSLLCVLTGASDLAILDPAVALAGRLDAHLEVLCLGLDATPPVAAMAGGEMILMPDLLREAGREAEALGAAATARLSAEDIRWSVARQATMVVGLGEIVAARARFCDLLIVPRLAAEGRAPGAEIVAESALFAGGAAVLVVPPAGLGALPGGTAVIAWDEGNEAMAAVRAALPLLRAAAAVSIAIVDPRRAGIGDAEPGATLAQFLSRHGIRAEVAVLAATEPRIADTLARHVRERGAGLLVMGAYGHSRLRELILGGTTRDMLRHAEVPVLLAH